MVSRHDLVAGRAAASSLMHKAEGLKEIHRQLPERQDGKTASDPAEATA